MVKDTRLVLENFINDLFSLGYECQKFNYAPPRLLVCLFNSKTTTTPGRVEVKRVFSSAQSSHISYFKMFENPGAVDCYCVFSRDFLIRVRWNWHSKVRSYDCVSFCFSRNLSVLELSHMFIELSRFWYVAALANLLELSLFNTYVCRMVDELVEVLVKLKRLRKLNIGMCRGNVNFYYMGAVDNQMLLLLKELPDLTWLEVCGTNLTSSACVRIVYSEFGPDKSVGVANYDEKIKSCEDDARLTYNDKFGTLITHPSEFEITWLKGQKMLDYLGILNCSEDCSETRDFPGVKDVAGSVTLEQVLVALKSYTYSTTMTHSAISAFKSLFSKQATADQYQLAIEAMLSSVKKMKHFLSLKNLLDQLEPDTTNFWTENLLHTCCKKCAFNNAYARYKRLFREFNPLIHSSCLVAH